MILIKRGTEPNALTEYKSKPGACYEEITADAKIACIEQMSYEQGHLCAYCMARVNDKSSPPRLEHYIPRNPAEPHENMRKDLDYTNMLAVCYGNSMIPKTKEEHTTCDAHRKNVKLSVNPFDVNSINEILYRGDGAIYSNNVNIDKDLNITLNLNCEKVSLKQNRKATLDR